MAVRLRQLTSASFATLALAFVIGPGCGKAKNLEIGIEDLDAMRPEASYVKYQIFENGCPGEESLRDSVAQDGFPQVFGATLPVDGALPSPGDLAAGKYGFAITLRNDLCENTAFGCTTVNIGNTTSFNIKVKAIADEEGNAAAHPICEEGTVCSDGECVEGEGGEGGMSGGEGGMSGSEGGKAGSSMGKAGAGGAGTAGSTGTGGSAGSGTAGSTGTGGSAPCGAMPGTGCTLQLVSTTALPPAKAKGGNLGGPGIIATKTGFIVGFHELNPDGAGGRIVITPLSSDGCLGNANEATYEFTPGCTVAPSAFDTGLGFAWNEDAGGATGGLGVATYGRAPCASRGAGLGFVRFSGGGGVLESKSFDNGDPAFPALSFASQHGAMRGLSNGLNEFRMMYTQAVPPDNRATAITLTIVGSGVGEKYDAVFGAEYWGGTTTTVGSATANFMVQAANITDQGNPAVGVVLTPVGQPPTTKIIAPGSKIATAAFPTGSGDRALVATSAGTDLNIHWWLYGTDGTEVAADKTLPNVTIAQTTGFDVTHINDRLVFVVGQPTGFRLFWVEGASGSPSAPAGMAEAALAQIPALAGFDGKQISIAAGNGRVAVAWVNHQNATDDPTGGVALFRCE